MARKIPADALQYYLGLGPTRSYAAVARHYGVSKRAITALARREDWQGQVDALHRRAQQTATEKTLEGMDAMNDRHLKAVRFLQSRAIEALRSMPLDTAIAAARALDLSIRQERAILGDTAETGGVEDVIRREYARWMVPGDGPEAEVPHDDPDRDSQAQ